MSASSAAAAATARLRKSAGGSGSTTDMRRFSTLDKGLGVHSVTSNKSFDTNDMEPQPRTRLGTLSEIRQRKTTMSSTNRSTHLATQQSSAGSSSTPTKDQSQSPQAGTDNSDTVSVNGNKKVVVSPSCDTVQTLSFSSGYSGLSSMQVEVLRQLSLDQSQELSLMPDIHVGSTSCIADLAILERKWSNMAMAQNIRGMKVMLSETPTIVNRADFIFGYTALHWAAKLENGRMVEVLMRFQADPSPISSNGSTPLHIAAKLGHDRVVRLLIEAGADCDIRDYNGRQAKDIAAPFLEQATKDMLYAGLRKGLSVRYGRTLSGRERSVVAHLLPTAPTGTRTSTTSVEKANFRTRVDRLVISLHLRRNRGGVASASSSSLNDISETSLSTSRHSLGGHSLGAHSTSDQLSPSLPLGMAASAGQRISRNLHTESRRGYSSRSSTNIGRQQQHGRRHVNGRLPLSWVPAVRKRALEVDFHDDDALVSGAKTSDSLPPSSMPSFSTISAIMDPSASDMQITVGNDSVFRSGASPSSPTSPSIPETTVTSPEKCSDA